MTYTSQQREVRDWLARREAILLAHNYQPAEIQDVADLTGDSLALSVTASTTPAKIIVFAGVHFMAETAAILCPDKTVLLPRLDVGCYMAETITPASLTARQAELPGVPVVAYVNSSAAVKAASDICCTSANAVKVVNSLSGPTVLMVPDKNLALYTARHTDKKILTWAGCCNIHDALTAREVLAAKAAHPQAASPGPPGMPPRGPGPGRRHPQHQRYAGVCPKKPGPGVHYRHRDGPSAHPQERKSRQILLFPL